MITIYPKPILYLRDYEAYKYYRNNIKSKGKNTVAWREHMNIVSRIFSKAADALLDNRSGVVLDKIGYFAAVRNPLRTIVTAPSYKTGQGNNIYYNLHSDRYMYYLKAFTDVHSRNMLNGWMMDYMFSNTIKRRFAAKLKTGHRYTLKLKLVRSLLKNWKPTIT